MEFLTSEPTLGLHIDPFGPGFPVETLFSLQSSTEVKGKGKDHPCTGTEALYRPCGP